MPTTTKKDVGTLVSPNEGLKQVPDTEKLPVSYEVGTLVSPNEGLKHASIMISSPSGSVGTLVSPNEGLKHRHLYQYRTNRTKSERL